MTGHNWSYCDEDECGPRRWPTGRLQSPINIDLNMAEERKTIDGIKFINYDKPISGDIVNNGHSVQVVINNAQERPEIFGSGFDQVYRLVQYHFHWGENDNEGSEHKISGAQFAGELHLVHQGVENPERFAVLGIFLQAGMSNRALHNEEEILSCNTLCHPSSARRIENIILAEKLPFNTKSFLRYEGSLTTPPCSEVVTWTIFTEPIEVTHEQLELFRSVKDQNNRSIKKNYRPLQKLNDRKVHYIVSL